MLFFTLLTLPVPVGSWHLFRILFRSASQGGGFTQGHILRPIIVTPAAHPDLRRSRRMVIGVGVFYAALFVRWICHAASRGI